MTLNAWLRYAQGVLEAAGVEDAHVDPIWLACQALNASRASLRLRGAQMLEPPVEEALMALLARRAAREPLQYILGNQPFMGLTFRTDPRALIPRQDTETLCELARELARAYRRPRVLDLCTGSGALGVSVARLCPGAQVTATDVSGDALSLARENAAALGAEVEFLQGDLFEPVSGRSFELILCNPPYIESGALASLQQEVRREPLLALDGGPDGLAFYRRIAQALPGALAQPSDVLMEVGMGQAQAVARLLEGALEGASISIERDLCGVERVVRAQRRGKRC